jgi:hypothetical protein
MRGTSKPTQNSCRFSPRWPAASIGIPFRFVRFLVLSFVLFVPSAVQRLPFATSFCIFVLFVASMSAKRTDVSHEGHKGHEETGDHENTKEGKHEKLGIIEKHRDSGRRPFPNDHRALRRLRMRLAALAPVLAVEVP